MNVEGNGEVGKKEGKQGSRPIESDAREERNYVTDYSISTRINSSTAGEQRTR